MVDSKSHSAATSVESIREVENKEKQFGRIEKLKERLKRNLNWLSVLFNVIVLFLAGVRLVLMVCILVHLGMFIVGTVRFNSCPGNNNITFYLVSAGWLCFNKSKFYLNHILGIIGAASKTITLIKTSLSEMFKFVRKLESALYATELMLFILGAYIIN